MPASTTFGCKENVNKERVHSSSSVFKISMNKYSNKIGTSPQNWHINNTSITYTVYAKTFL
jgi:hypothetical protein